MVDKFARGFKKKMKIKKPLLYLILILVLYGLWEIAGIGTHYYLTKEKDILIDSPEFVNNYFPEEYLNITKIYFVKSACLKIKEDFCTMGEYTPFSKIYIAVKNPKDRVIFNIYHETGHHIWRYYLNQDNRLNWTKYYNLNGGITEYSQESDANEDFSEYYALMQTNFNMDHNNEDIDREMILNEFLKENPKFDLR